MTSFAELRNPAAFARARAELDAAEQRARAEATSTRQRAEIDAQQAAEAAVNAEVNSLLGPWEPVEAAQAALQELFDKQNANAAEIKTAEQTAAQARAVLPRLVDRAVAGELVTSNDIAKAHAAIASADHRLTFLGVVATRFPSMIAEAETGVKAAIAVAHQPIYERGVDLRIDAAVASDAARPVDANGNFTGHTDSEALEAAWKIFYHANRLLHYAARHGVKIASLDGITVHGPSRPNIERRRWKRPLPEVSA